MSSSILISSGHPGHSADVRIRLLINGTSFPVGQLGPDFLLLKTPFDHPRTDATIVLCVDGNERQWKVHLPDGISAGSRWVVVRDSK
ncbi:MAG: hypothetical protein M3463_12245 [Verrucomicrobiota bacterium]|nr:hypothetical protein [Verrucomicrobiota bacterium]